MCHWYGSKCLAAEGYCDRFLEHLLQFFINDAAECLCTNDAESRHSQREGGTLLAGGTATVVLVTARIQLNEVGSHL